jgi:hypothetical protein
LEAPAKSAENAGAVMDPPEKSAIEAFREGLIARAQRRDLRSNPYPPCTVEAFLWEGGWLSPDDGDRAKLLPDDSAATMAALTGRTSGAPAGA